MKDEIELDGITYMNKGFVDDNFTANEEVEKKIADNKGVPRKNIEGETFSVIEEGKMHKAMSKILNDALDCVSETFCLNMKEVVVIDSANVCMFVAKTDRAKGFLRRYIDVEQEKDDKDVKLEYEMPTKENVLKSKYSSDYMKKALDFFAVLNTKNITTGVNIKIKNDYPMTIENDDFKFVLAPRVEND